MTVSQEKWDKGKDIIKHWHKRVIDEKDRTLRFKDLEKDMGYLVLLSSITIFSMVGVELPILCFLVGGPISAFSF